MEQRSTGYARYIVAILIAVGLAYAIQHRARLRAEEAKSATPSAAPRKVLFTHAKGASSSATVSIPATVRPAESITLQARAQGFVREVKVNIGAQVKKGDLLAIIDAPELFDQLTLARARLKEAEANVPLVKTRADRMEQLLAKGAVSQQEADDAIRAHNTAVAAVSTARADVSRLQTGASYLRVTAPFAGTIVKRFVDPGANVSSGATPLLELSTTNALKIVVDVPQSIAAAVTKDFAADITTKQGVVVKATLLRAATALDEVTRTLRLELAVPDGSPLIAGAYVDVKIATAAGAATRIIPATTLSVGAQGTRVAIVTADNKVQYRGVKIVRDMGRELEVTSDITAEDRLIMFPAVDLTDGEVVTAVAGGVAPK